MRLSDHGRGLPLAALRDELGCPESPDGELAKAIFEFGVSTAAGVS